MRRSRISYYILYTHAANRPVGKLTYSQKCTILQAAVDYIYVQYIDQGQTVFLSTCKCQTQVRQCRRDTGRKYWRSVSCWLHFNKTPAPAQSSLNSGPGLVWLESQRDIRRHGHPPPPPQRSRACGGKGGGGVIHLWSGVSQGPPPGLPPQLSLKPGRFIVGLGPPILIQAQPGTAQPSKVN